jgi:Fe-S-cluster containining protein
MDLNDLRKMDPQQITAMDTTIDGQVGSLEKQFARGLQFADMLGFTNQQQLLENRVLLHALAELLIGKGILHLQELEERKKQVADYLEQQDQHPKVHLVFTEDKYRAESYSPSDCENRVHVCKASCCKLWFALSVQDMEERIVHWNYAQPFAIAQREDGYCVHHTVDSKYLCGVYENRPLICRNYTCKDDKRIWLDFEAYVINPDVLRPDWPQPATVSDKAKPAEPGEQVEQNG